MLHQSLAWWLVVEGIGLVALPLTLSVFGSLPGRGYAFAKPAGILLGAYLFWLALSLHLLANRPGSIVWAYVPIGIASFVIYRRRRDELVETLKERLGYIIAVELVFTLVFALAIYLKSYIPEIGGTEKPMDFLFLNAATRSRFYPPADPWLAGSGVSYYYFGYVIQAMLGKLAALPTAITFNVALASTAALAATAAFGLGYELVRSAVRATFRAAIVTGVAAALLLVVVGNLEGVLEFGAANSDLPASVVRRVDIANLNTAQPSHTCAIGAGSVCLDYPNEQSSFWWWWRATRISPDANSITEFPFFSFLLGDLHPHVMALPFVLTCLALGLTFWRMGPLNLDCWKRHPLFGLVSAILIGGLGFLNTWDLPTFGFIVVVLVVAKSVVRALQLPPPASDDETSPQSALSFVVSESAGFLLPLALVAVVLYLPFYVSFSSQASGLAAVTNGATRPIQSVLFWAPLVALSLPLPLVLLARDDRASVWRRLRQAVLLPLALLAFWVVVIVASKGAGAVGDAFTSRGLNWLTTLFYAGALVAGLTALVRRLEAHDDDSSLVVPVLALTTTAFLLILGAELFYIKDVFGTRLNTVFKLSYQAWLLLAVGGAAGVYWLASEWQPAASMSTLLTRRVWGGVAALLLLGALLYPVGATLSRTNGLSSSGRSLDGLAVARVAAPDDFAAIDWLKLHAGPNERIVEATGGEYSAFDRVSVDTGVPTVIGWVGHETQWGRPTAPLAQRQADVDFIYSTPSLADALAMLRKYDVTYVFVGTLEHSKYPADGLAKFDSGGLPSAFTAGGTTIYRVPQLQAAVTGAAP